MRNLIFGVFTITLAASTPAIEASALTITPARRPKLQAVPFAGARPTPRLPRLPPLAPATGNTRLQVPISNRSLLVATNAAFTSGPSNGDFPLLRNRAFFDRASIITPGHEQAPLGHEQADSADIRLERPSNPRNRALTAIGSAVVLSLVTTKATAATIATTNAATIADSLAKSVINNLGTLGLVSIAALIAFVVEKNIEGRIFQGRTISRAWTTLCNILPLIMTMYSLYSLCIQRSYNQPLVGSVLSFAIFSGMLTYNAAMVPTEQTPPRRRKS